jgi:hypothetical protein
MEFELGYLAHTLVILVTELLLMILKFYPYQSLLLTYMSKRVGLKYMED